MWWRGVAFFHRSVAVYCLPRMCGRFNRVRIRKACTWAFFCSNSFFYYFLWQPLESEMLQNGDRSNTVCHSIFKIPLSYAIWYPLCPQVSFDCRSWSRHHPVITFVWRFDSCPQRPRTPSHFWRRWRRRRSFTSSLIVDTRWLPGSWNRWCHLNEQWYLQGLIPTRAR